MSLPRPQERPHRDCMVFPAGDRRSASTASAASAKQLNAHADRYQWMCSASGSRDPLRPGRPLLRSWSLRARRPESPESNKPGRTRYDFLRIETAPARSGSLFSIPVWYSAIPPRTADEKNASPITLPAPASGIGSIRNVVRDRLFRDSIHFAFSPAFSTPPEKNPCQCHSGKGDKTAMGSEVHELQVHRALHAGASGAIIEDSMSRIVARALAQISCRADRVKLVRKSAGRQNNSSPDNGRRRMARFPERKEIASTVGQPTPHFPAVCGLPPKQWRVRPPLAGRSAAPAGDGAGGACDTS